MNNVTRFDISVPLLNIRGCYNLFFDDDNVVSEDIYDPVELVADISNEYQNWDLNFDNAEIFIYTATLCVDKEYVESHKDLIKGNQICVYHDTFENILKTYDFNLPIPQYCIKLFLLYINSCKYIKTIQSDHRRRSENR